MGLCTVDCGSTPSFPSKHQLAIFPYSIFNMCGLFPRVPILPINLWSIAEPNLIAPGKKKDGFWKMAFCKISFKNFAILIFFHFIHFHCASTDGLLATVMSMPVVALSCMNM